ncbi:hypothetical protein BHU24_05315 [Bacillus pseudomycoides]|uniref:hypothetical protein n=1 Tax=Bacillus pseudomycoides TaxID=64104 RepID=UPI000BEB59B9|nr:hypothetical protein [Bacillus pseudomycoides]MBD5798414.1 hypothetical protein [Bacillus pseudomycoides]PDY48456.1 hypothetical protein CON79_04360 [Bacillus pseudomycoides]PHB44229.1 hypothetical protein COE83_18905 [Bacillus pseudomycoides]
MELTKLEKVIVISAFAQGLSDQEFANYAGEHTLEQLNKELEKLFDNSAPKEMREARVNILNKFIQDLLKENKK